MGIKDLVKGIFGKKPEDNPAVLITSLQGKPFDSLIDDLQAEVKDEYLWYFKLTHSKTYKEKISIMPDKDKVSFILGCVTRIVEWDLSDVKKPYNDKGSRKNELRKIIVDQLLKTKIKIDESDFSALARSFLLPSPNSYYVSLIYWPVKSLLSQIGTHYKNTMIPATVKKSLESIKTEALKLQQSNNEKEIAKMILKIDELLATSLSDPDEVKPVLFLGNDGFKEFANDMIRAFPAKDKIIWNQLMALAQKASGGKPTNKFLDQGKTMFTELGADKFKKMMQVWFEFLVKAKNEELRRHYGSGQDTYHFTTEQLVSAPNGDALKGFVWMCANFHDTHTLQSISDLAERCYKKIPGQGQTATALGNACVYTLFKSKGLEGIGLLSKLKLKMTLTGTKQLIEKYLDEAAKTRGVSIDEIEDLSNDDFGLVHGERIFELEGYKAVVKIVDMGKVNLEWYKPDGTFQKSDPAIVKEKQAAKLKKIKSIQKQVSAGLSTQRDRLDASFKTGRVMSWDHFQQYYFNHGLMYFLTRKLIWQFEKKGTRVEGTWFEDKWVDANKSALKVDDSYTVSLWHPANASTDGVKAWRTFLMENQIQQPLKQAYREIYLLTDAELNTRTYSNRMASHILKQHQFNSLAKIRGWKYSLIGCFDGGDYGGAKINLPAHNLRAEYWINEINGDMTESGIWTYISTDQVRFINTQTNQVIALVDVPVIAFSEIMRDVDLFVGVSSIGNDPNWQDNPDGNRYNDYWQSYSFGDLTELAKTRKEILEKLIPRLKIARVAEIKDKFLVVKGKLRTYKIHLGSTNILMEPNDQYLCIVPDRGAKTHTDNVFLPFEGDNGLSVILSKAFLLADDDKITDGTITSQINR